MNKQNSNKHKGNRKPSYNGGYDNKRQKRPNQRTTGDDLPRKSDDNVHVSGPVNDASYYFSDELLKNQITTISFNEFAGVPINFGTTAGGYASLKVPTTMIIELNPSAGFTDPDTGMGNALNLTALGLYTQLSANNAKTTNYAPQDITTLFLALGSAISLSSHIARVFGVAYLYSQRNRTYPRELVQQLGVNYDDLMSNFANYRAQYNRIINAASAIAFPAEVAYFKKCSELYSGIYLDMEGSAMAQTYAMVPHSVWMFDEESSPEGTMLTTFNVYDDTRLVTMNALLSILDQLFAALLSSATLNYIYADILRVADKGMGLYHFSLIPDNYVVLPQFDAEIRKWINNLVIVGKPLGVDHDGDHTAANNVYPDADTNKIVYRPQFAVPDTLVTLDKVLNFDYGTYTNDDIVYATRLMSAWTIKLKDGSPDEYVTDVIALPDHYVVAVHLMYKEEYMHTFRSSAVDSHSGGFLSQLSAFDWGPMFYVRNRDTGQFDYYFGDLNYYTLLDYEYIRNLQDTTYYGLFEIR